MLHLSTRDRAQDYTDALAALQEKESSLLRKLLQEEEYLAATDQMLQLRLFQHSWISAKEEATVLHRYTQIPLAARDKLWGHLRALDGKRLSVASRLIAAEEARAREQPGLAVFWRHLRATWETRSALERKRGQAYNIEGACNRFAQTS